MISSTNEETEKSDDIHISFLSFFFKIHLALQDHLHIPAR